MISHFYHLYADGDYYSTLSYHMNMLRSSKLYNYLNFLGIGFVGSSDNIKKAKKDLENLNIDYVTVAETEIGYEQETLDKLYDYCLNNNCNIFYGHTKGSYEKTEINIKWSESMVNFNIREWENCIEYLNNYDSVGCHWLTKYKYNDLVEIPFFAGNYWWIKSDKIKELQKPNRNSRYDAESWIGQIKDLKVFDLCPGWPSIELFNKITYTKFDDSNM